MKKIIFTLLMGLGFKVSVAQVGYNYDRYEIGLSTGLNSSSTDFLNSRPGYAVLTHFTYNFTPYLNYIAEFQVGSLKADSLKSGVGAYSFKNDYTAVAFRVQLQAGELFDYSQSRFKNAFKNIYVSAGIGVAYTDLTLYNANVFSAENKTSNAYIPLKIGYELKLFDSYNEPWAKLDIGYQVNYVLSDTFDGVASGKADDYFSQFTIGFKFGIGGKTSYRKAIGY